MWKLHINSQGEKSDKENRFIKRSTFESFT